MPPSNQRLKGIGEIWNINFIDPQDLTSGELKERFFQVPRSKHYRIYIPRPLGLYIFWDFEFRHLTTDENFNMLSELVADMNHEVASLCQIT